MLNEVDVDRITIHGRVALALLAAEHVSTLVESRDLMAAIVRDGWSWIERRTPNPEVMYWSLNPKLMEDELRYHEDELLLAAFHCGLYAHYYTVWKAYGVASQEEPGVVYSIGNDIAEVDESYLSQGLHCAVQASPRPGETERWLNETIERMRREHPILGDDRIGAKVHRLSFSVPMLRV